MKKVAILQSNYIPWRGYFDIINKVDVFVVYDEVQYTKNDWRNRNKIKTPHGPAWLTIPVRRERLHQTIGETRVARSDWNIKHWASIKANYSKAPFFEKYEETFRRLYLDTNTPLLSEINLKFLRAIISVLGIHTEIVDSRTLNLSGDRNERLIQAIKAVDGTHYLSGPAAKDYLDIGAFNAHGIQVEWMDYSGYRSYPQLHPPFCAGLSILDAIFNCGPGLPEFSSENGGACNGV